MPLGKEKGLLPWPFFGEFFAEQFVWAGSHFLHFRLRYYIPVFLRSCLLVIGHRNPFFCPLCPGLTFWMGSHFLRFFFFCFGLVIETQLSAL